MKTTSTVTVLVILLAITIAGCQGKQQKATADRASAGVPAGDDDLRRRQRAPTPGCSTEASAPTSA